MPRKRLDLKFQAPRKPSAGAAHRSFWFDQAMADDSHATVRKLEGTQNADVCIVGGGFTALWTALRLLQQAPATRVAIVEADLCGSGASGRNSGAMGHWWAKLPTLVRLLGDEDALRVLKYSVDILADVRRFIATEGIRCDLRLGPSVWSTNFKGQPGGWLAMMKTAERLGIEPPHRHLSADELRGYFGEGPYYAGVVEEDVIRLQPAALARELRRLALERGVAVFEHSPVTSVDNVNDVLKVHTEKGEVIAGKVLLAANAWMADLEPFRDTIAVVSSDIVITDPIPELLERLGMRRRPGGVNSRLMLNYGGLTPDGRVYVGRGGGSIAYGNRLGPAFDYSAAQAAEVEEDFRYLYPELKQVPIARSWAGPIDRSPSGLPCFGQLGDDSRVHYAIGYSGHGLGAAALGAYILTAKLLEQTNEWSELGACFLRASRGHYPPEPWRNAAARLIRGGVARKERAARDGKTPRRLDTKLSSYAMASLPDRKPRR